MGAKISGFWERGCRRQLAVGPESFREQFAVCKVHEWESL